MFGTTFGHSTIRKLVIYFGTLFNNIHLNRYDSLGDLVQNMRVPLQYGPHEKFLARSEGNPDSNRPIAIQLPRMSFEMAGFTFDPSRKMSRMNIDSIAVPGSPGVKNFQYAPVPYDIKFNLYIMVKNAEDGTFIIEQILPYFQPEWTATINLNNDLSKSYDIPLILNDISGTDTYEGNFIERRAIIWTLQFTMKAWFFGPTKEGRSIIKEMDLGFKIPPVGMSITDAFGVSEAFTDNIQITPGLNSNGEAVSWYGAEDAGIRPTSVAANTILSTSNYGFMIDFMNDNP